MTQIFITYSMAQQCIYVNMGKVDYVNLSNLVVGTFPSTLL